MHLKHRVLAALTQSPKAPSQALQTSKARLLEHQSSVGRAAPALLVVVEAAEAQASLERARLLQWDHLAANLRQVYSANNSSSRNLSVVCSAIPHKVHQVSYNQVLLVHPKASLDNRVRELVEVSLVSPSSRN